MIHGVLLLELMVGTVGYSHNCGTGREIAVVMVVVRKLEWGLRQPLVTHLYTTCYVGRTHLASRRWKKGV